MIKILSEARLQPLPNLPPTPAPRTRVAVLGSFMSGYHVLKELLAGELADRVIVVGVATDDPSQAFTHASVTALIELDSKIDHPPTAISVSSPDESAGATSTLVLAPLER